MARNKKTVEMIVGTEVQASEAEAQSGKIGEGRSTPDQGGEVGGRSGMEYVICPRCNAINYVYVDDIQYLWYRCWNTSVGRHYFKV
jgi:hypothetical protein